MEESIDRLLACRNVVINRITSPRGFASDEFLQDEDEFVLLVSGSATLDIEGRVVDLHAGQHLFIPAKTRHRILGTSGDRECVWLAVHIH
jgi:cupin 2 domain-containing protein